MNLKSGAFLILSILLAVVGITILTEIFNTETSNYMLEYLLAAFSLFAAPYCFGVAIEGTLVYGFVSYFKLLFVWLGILLLSFGILNIVDLIQASL